MIESSDSKESTGLTEILNTWSLGSPVTQLSIVNSLMTLVILENYFLEQVLHFSWRLEHGIYWVGVDLLVGCLRVGD